MTNNPPLARHPGETDAAYRYRVRKYITKHAPAEHRYFVRGGKPGGRAQRWLVPGLFMAIGLFFALSGYVMGADIRTLNGPDGARGEFVVESLAKRYDESAKNNTVYTPVVAVRGMSIVPLNSKPQENKYAVGDTVDLRYSQHGKIVASFLNEDGEAEGLPSTILTAMGIVFVVIGLLIGKFYRGAVDHGNVEKELAKLTA